jgi:hypothetical protein
VNNAAAVNMPKYTKVWEGSLSGQRQGQSVFINKIEGYVASDHQNLAAYCRPFNANGLAYICLNFAFHTQFIKLESEPSDLYSDRLYIECR